jgi:hypothetical protein
LKNYGVQTDWQVVTNVRDIMALGNKGDYNTIEPRETSAVPCPQLKQASDDVSLNKRPSSLVECTTKTIQT